MGISFESIALYRQLKQLGLFDSVRAVMEVGSQDLKCRGHERAVTELYEAFGKAPGSEGPIVDGAARRLYEALGFSYACVDTDGRYGALALDLNFDPVPEDRVGRYDFVTNHGTTEHLCNQGHAFKVIHDFTRPGGLMLHVLPFLGVPMVDHGFFCYQPNFFEAMARHNGYDVCGIWLGIQNGTGSLSSLIPWSPDLLRAVTLAQDSFANICVLMRKVHTHPFIVPFQGKYEGSRTAAIAGRYSYVVDGELLDGRRIHYYGSSDALSGSDLARELFLVRIPRRIKLVLSRLIGR